MSQPQTSQDTFQIETRTSKSFLISTLQTVLKPFRPHLIKPKKEFPAGSPELDVHKTAKSRCNVTARQVEGIWIYDMTAKSSRGNVSGGEGEAEAEGLGKGKGGRKRIFYFAGGGWQMPPSPEHWKLSASLATRIPNSIVSIISYPLAPSSPASKSLPALRALYPHLFTTTTNEQEEEEVIFAGDSAGGNVVLGLLFSMLALKPEVLVPEKLVLVSPAVDLRVQPNEEHTPHLENADKIDPLLGIAFTNSTAANWSRGLDPSLPEISPLLADVALLRERGVRVYGISAGADVLGPPALAFAEKCREVGVQGRWLEWRGVMHCFPLAFCYGLKEGKEGLEWILRAMRE